MYNQSMRNEILLKGQNKQFQILRGKVTHLSKIILLFSQHILQARFLKFSNNVTERHLSARKLAPLSSYLEDKEGHSGKQR